VPHSDAFFLGIKVEDGSIREVRHHRLIKLYFTLFIGDGDKGGHDAFRYRGLIMNGRAVIGIEVSICQYLAISDYQQAVDVNVLLPYGQQRLSQFG
jgi:hypothetical protein